MFKVGDYVTQNDVFTASWNCETFHLRIIKIVNDVIYLDGYISIFHRNIMPSSIYNTNSLHENYLKLDTQHIRKLKLEKLKNV